MGTLKLIESIEDDYTFGRAWIEDQDGALVPRAIFGGIMVNIDTKPGLLAAGVAWCEPVDGTPENAWPIATVIEHESGTRETLWNTTGNARIVAAARAYAEAMENGTAAAGKEL